MNFLVIQIILLHLYMPQHFSFAPITEDPLNLEDRFYLAYISQFAERQKRGAPEIVSCTNDKNKEFCVWGASFHEKDERDRYRTK